VDHKNDDPFLGVDWDNGVGIAGHSMGGQSTTIAANAACAAQFDIRAAAVHHPGKRASGKFPGSSDLPRAEQGNKRSGAFLLPGHTTNE
jgi:hypothetical protein